MTNVNYMEVAPAESGMLPIDVYAQEIPNMSVSAQFSRENEALSYRVRVGSTALLHNEATDQYMTISAANLKLAQGVEKYCAEMALLDELDRCNEALEEASQAIDQDLGLLKPVGLVTVGPSDEDTIYGITARKTPTLHMCEACVTRHDEHELVEDSLLSTTMPADLRYFEMHTLKEYKKIYAELGESAIKKSAYPAGFDNWGSRAKGYGNHILNLLNSPKMELDPSPVA